MFSLREGRRTRAGRRKDVMLPSPQEYLEQLHKDEKLTSLSLWKELCPNITKDQRYHDMLGQPGTHVRTYAHWLLW